MLCRHHSMAPQAPGETQPASQPACLEEQEGGAVPQQHLAPQRRHARRAVPIVKPASEVLAGAAQLVLAMCRRWATRPCQEGSIEEVD